MEELTPLEFQYASYLVRIWRGDKPGSTAANDWQGEIEHIQSGRHTTFATLQELASLLQEDGILPVVTPGSIAERQETDSNKNQG